MYRLLLLVAVVTTLFVTSSATANQAARSANPQASAARRGPVPRLIELERRKNEWLRQRFGR